MEQPGYAVLFSGYNIYILYDVICPFFVILIFLMDLLLFIVFLFFLKKPDVQVYL
jgi:hypothetical protein